MLKKLSADAVDAGGSTGDTVDGGVIEDIFTIPAEADFLIANSTVPGLNLFW